MALGMMAPIITIAGIAIGSVVVEKIMEETGQGGKVVFVRVISWVAAGLYAIDYWWSGVRYVMQTFDVY
jgi:hypothetical protein